MNLEYLDMAIAFAVVMLAVSLLVTTGVQLVSAVLGLRGTNLLWGVTQLLRTVHPALGDRAEQAARAVLEHELISDSSLSRFAWLAKTPLVGRWFKRLRLAKAVRVDELIGIIGIIAEKEAAIVTTGGQAAREPDGDRLNVPAGLPRSTRGQHAAIAPTPAGEASAPSPGSLTAVLSEDDARAVQGAGVPGHGSGTAQLRLAKAGIEAWFNTAMDRTSQRFAFQARLWTVAFSVVIAFALHLDTFTLMKQFASDAEVRARVAGVSESIEQLAAASLAAPRPTTADQQTPAGSGNSAAAGQETSAAVQQAPAPGAQQPAGGPPARASASTPGEASDAAAKPPALYHAAMTTLPLPAKAMSAMPGFFADRVTATNWLRTSLENAGMGADAIEQQVAAYAAAVDRGLASEVDRLSDRALSLRGILSGAGFQLIPSPYHGWDFWPLNLHFWGIVFSACLLSLGAPFWFNTLKGLSALKPVVASKEAKERQAVARTTVAGTSPPSAP